MNSNRLARSILAALLSLGVVSMLALVFAASWAFHWVLHLVGGP